MRDNGRGEQVLERGSGEQVRDGGVGVEGREMEGGGERLLRRPHCSLFSLLLMVGGTGVFPGPCRSAVTVDEETDGTSSVGGFGKAGLDFLPSAGGSAVLGVGGLLPPCWLESGFSVKVTDRFWSPCASGLFLGWRLLRVVESLAPDLLRGSFFGIDSRGRRSCLRPLFLPSGGWSRFC